MHAGFKLDQGEEVVRRVNHHWIELFSLASVSGVMVFLALIITYGYARYKELFPSTLGGPLVFLLVILFLIIAVLVLVVGIWVYNRNFILITNKHIVQMEQKGLFTSQVDQVSLGRVQDVTGTRAGMLATMLNFGTVSVQSAGEQRQFVFHNVEDPQQLADYILELHEQYLERNPNSAD